jgi:hypothetical protein
MLTWADVFPKAIDSDLIVRTNAGGVLSLLSFATICYYVTSEIYRWSIVNPKFRMVVNDGRLPEKLPISLDIIVSNNCTDLHFEFTNLRRTLMLESENDTSFVQEEDSCHITSKLTAPNVPASLHIGLGESFPSVTGEHQHMWYLLYNRNVSHHINHVSFGDLHLPSPIEDTAFILEKAVPYQITYVCQLINVRRRSETGYQMSVSLLKTNLERIRSVGITGIVFEWNFSPIGLVWEDTREPIIRLITRIFAVLGCLLALANMVDRTVFGLQKCCKRSRAAMAC